MNPGKFFLHIALIFLTVGALTACQTSSEPGAKMYHVGILAGLDVFDDVIDGFKNEMAVQGYIEGDNITYEIKRANGDPDIMQQIADKFVAERVDLIVTITNGAALAARRATANTDIPGVFTFVLAPVETGVVDDLAKPGGSLTGVRNPLEIFVGKRLEILQQIDPRYSRVWIPYYPGYVTEQVILPRAREDAGKLGVTLVESQITTANDVLAAIAEFSASPEIPFKAILIMPDLVVQSPQSWEAIKQFAEANHLPIIANNRQQVEDGALYGYFIDDHSTGETAARMAKLVLAGVPPSEIPIKTADVSLVINIKTAEALGLELPSVLLHQADTFIR